MRGRKKIQDFIMQFMSSHRKEVPKEDLDRYGRCKGCVMDADMIIDEVLQWREENAE